MPSTALLHRRSRASISEMNGGRFDAPIVMFLCGVANVLVPPKVLITSVVVFIVVPLTAGWLTRTLLLKSHGKDWF